MLFQHPYKKTKCTFDHKTYGKIAGVYFIKEGSEIVYIGMSQSSVYKAMYRHFQVWADYRFDRKVYPATKEYTCFVHLTDAPVEDERAFIREYQPRDNREMYDTKFEYVEDDSWWMQEHKRMQNIDIPF